MGDAKLDNASRIGLTLQGYDQVIALSQTSINQTLKRHFKIDNTALSNFTAQLGHPKDPDNFLQGKINSPTIQLVDADKADQAIYTFQFLKGAEYMYYYKDPEIPRDSGKQKKISAEGWKISFFVSFAMEKAAQLPVAVQEVVMKVASYSVEQLVIVFGSAELLTLAPDLCEFPGLENDRIALLEVKTSMGAFINTWLSQLRNADPGQSHNILGYTVKLGVKGDPSLDQLTKKIGNLDTISYPPTSVQFQTIANKPDAKSLGNIADPYNAFLFTEMTGGRPFPQSDLQWSGNWFYGTTQGTMNMSSSIFLRDFVGALVEPIHQRCIYFVDPLAKRQTWDAEMRIKDGGSEFLSKWTHGTWLLTNANQWQMESTTQKSYHDVLWRDNGDHLVQLNIEAKMTSTIVPVPATGNFDIQQKITIVTKWTKEAEQYTFNATSISPWKYTVTLTSIESGGLTSSVVYSIGKSTLASNIRQSGVLTRGIGSNQNKEEGEKWDNYETLLKNTIKDRMSSSTDFTNTINDGLNGQKRFIFPGGGTFDMSDPIFSQAGDLLVGLVYKSGKL